MFNAVADLQGACTMTCLLLVLLLLVLMAERARHLVHPVQRHLHQPRELDISSDLLMDTSARIFKFQGLHHLMMAARMPLPTSRSTQSFKEPNLVMLSTMTPSMTTLHPLSPLAPLKAHRVGGNVPKTHHHQRKRTPACHRRPVMTTPNHRGVAHHSVSHSGNNPGVWDRAPHVWRMGGGVTAKTDMTTVLTTPRRYTLTPVSTFALCATARGSHHRPTPAHLL